MQTSAELRDRARHCRELAALTEDESARVSLQRLAREFEQEAVRMEGRAAAKGGRHEHGGPAQAQSTSASSSISASGGSPKQPSLCLDFVQAESSDAESASSNDRPAL